MMISKKMNEALNEQVGIEFLASHAYLAMACAADAMGLKIVCEFFMKQSEEEREHALKIVNYLRDVGATATFGGIEKPAGSFDSLEALAQAALDNELDVTRRINELVSMAEAEKDYATRSFLEWFVDEQVEEVASMTDLLQLVKLSKGNLLQVEMRIRHQMTKPS